MFQSRYAFLAFMILLPFTAHAERKNCVITDVTVLSCLDKIRVVTDVYLSYRGDVLQPRTCNFVLYTRNTKTKQPCSHYPIVIMTEDSSNLNGITRIIGVAKTNARGIALLSLRVRSTIETNPFICIYKTDVPFKKEQEERGGRTDLLLGISSERCDGEP